mmetsp:Transcript_101789/g.175718  ORF Transcript_101789/g.175718 Transcript_101789/m.175718 type:complete len:210 (+) Transcript_101789:1401-2030(+)
MEGKCWYQYWALFRTIHTVRKQGIGRGHHIPQLYLLRSPVEGYGCNPRTCCTWVHVIKMGTSAYKHSQREEKEEGDTPHLARVGTGRRLSTMAAEPYWGRGCSLLRWIAGEDGTTLRNWDTFQSLIVDPAEEFVSKPSETKCGQHTPHANKQDCLVLGLNGSDSLCHGHFRPIVEVQTHQMNGGANYLHGDRAEKLRCNVTLVLGHGSG